MAKTELAKAYEPQHVERKWYSFWFEQGCFRLPSSEERPGAKAFCITIPPPNVTGSLHIGHALQHSIHDCIARWRRLKGDRVLVVPGTDHAAISTNMKVEQALVDEGMSRHSIGREAFLERCWEWTRHYGGRIIEQLKALGCSYDWDRTRFTLDEAYYRAVLTAFVRFYQRGWIYRGHRVVNWCPTCASTVSDLEVEYMTHSGRFWHIRYPIVGEDGHVIVATTRPETMLGDTAVAVNSQDSRYRHLHGKRVMLPLMQREIPIIVDDLLVDPEMGTGAVKVTPAHDLSDFEAGQRNNLPAVTVIGTDGRMREEAKQYAGLDRYEARRRVLDDLRARGLLVQEEDHEYQIGQHDRCHTVLEPLLSEQWFLRMKEPARMALEVVQGESPQVRYTPDRFRQYTINWLENLRDWNISRQIWWGHRIPVYTCVVCGHVMVEVEAPARCEVCGGTVQQDEDTLDTWFSSALWPSAVLGWPDQQEMRTSVTEGVYPTQLMITARDILYLWIVRMIMTSLEFTDRVPFAEVLVHPTVLNLEGRRMSKSLGTGLDPLELIAQYGADATRFSLLHQCGTDQDIRFGEERTEMARNFCNKIWNASRFVLMNLPQGFRPATDTPDRIRSEGGLAERWILSRYTAMLAAVEEALSHYEMAEATRALYEFFWSEFCDWFVEMSKPALRVGGPAGEVVRQTLWYVLERTLRVLHPFMPFITEEIWQQLREGGQPLMVAEWPRADAVWRDPQAEAEMEALMHVVTAGRESRAQQWISPGKNPQLYISSLSEAVRRLIEGHKDEIELLVGCRQLHFRMEAEHKDWTAVVAYPFGDETVVRVAGSSSVDDLEVGFDRLCKRVEQLRQDEEKLRAKLDNPEFTERAPADIVAKTQARLAEVRAQREAAEAQRKSAAAQRGSRYPGSGGV